MKLIFAAILLFLPFILPIVFQIVWGNRNIKNKTRLKIWQTTIISIVMMCLSVLLLDIFLMRPATARTHDGLGYLFLIALMVLNTAVILVIMATQYIIQYRKNKKIEDKQ